MTDLGEARGAGPLPWLGPNCSLFQDPFWTPGTGWATTEINITLRQSPLLSKRLDERVPPQPLTLPQRSLPRFPFFCPPPTPRQPAPPPITYLNVTNRQIRVKSPETWLFFFRVTSQQPFPLHPRESLPFPGGSATSSPGLFPGFF